MIRAFLLALVLTAFSVPAAATETVNFTSRGATLSGTLNSPANPRAGIVLIHGSGPDGEAEYETQAAMFRAMGLATVTYDKRGWDKSGGDWRVRDVDLLADDAIAAANVLRNRLKIPVGYWGISQGGWVLAKVAARDEQAAFLIGVATAGVSPFEQERWHKREMMNAAGAPSWLLRPADRFWAGALDLMIVLDGHRSFLPSLLENERAGSSFGLAYDPWGDWQSSHAPLLLLYGTEDRLEPWFDSGPRIAANRPVGAITEIRNFEGASHTITTRTTGLTFDWDAHFHRDYAPTMRRFIDSSLSSDHVVERTQNASMPPWPGRPLGAAAVTILTLLFLPVTAIALLLKGRTKWARLLVVADIAAWTALVVLIATTVFPFGSFYEPAASFPWWSGSVPLVILAALTVALVVIVRTLRRKESKFVGMCALVTLAFAATWL